MRRGVELPVIYELLECGHVIEDPGKHAKVRLCRKCNDPNAPRPLAPEVKRPVIHYQQGDSKQARCAVRRNTAHYIFTNDPQQVTCLSCIRKLVRDGVLGDRLSLLDQLPEAALKQLLWALETQRVGGPRGPRKRTSRARTKAK
jgi:hypothetical protein